MGQKKKHQQVLIVGLGRFGQSLAFDLAQLGAEVMGVDHREDAVEESADELTHAMIADCTEEKVLREFGVDQFDLVICAIGGDIQASIMTTLLLKELGAKRLVAKASTNLHGKVLEKIGVDRVVFPEREMAHRLAQDFMTPRFTEVLHLTVQQSMFEMPAPSAFAGVTLGDLHLRRRFGLNVLAIRRSTETVVDLDASTVICRGDVLLVLGNRQKAQEAMEGEEEGEEN